MVFAMGNHGIEQQKEIIRIIAELKEIDVEIVKLESRLIEDLDLDSLDLVILLQEFQNKFGYSISNNKIPGIRTVNDIIEIVKNEGR